MAAFTELSWLVGTLATWAMVGVIWVVQLAIYPQFRRISRTDWLPYHAAHVRAMGPIAGPLMIAELLTASWWLWQHTQLPAVDAWAAVTLFILTLATFVLTFAGAMPLHRRLQTGYKEALITRLLRVNWLRTITWSSKGALLLWLWIR